MTKKELSQLYWLNREIEQDYKRLAELEAAATNANARITGLPHVSRISDKTAIAAEIADVKTIIQAKQQMCIAEYNRLNRFVATISDSVTRQIVTLRYVDGMAWNQVASCLGEGYTAESVRQTNKRFLDRN